MNHLRLIAIACFITLTVAAAFAAKEPWSFRAGRGITLGDASATAIALAVTEVEARADLSMDAAIPASALLETVRGDFVYTRNGDAYLRVAVKTGARSGGFVDITDGLFEGDEVVSSGAKDLWMIELQAVNGGRGCADGH